MAEAAARDRGDGEGEADLGVVLREQRGDSSAPRNEGDSGDRDLEPGAGSGSVSGSGVVEVE